MVFQGLWMFSRFVCAGDVGGNSRGLFMQIRFPVVSQFDKGDFQHSFREESWPGRKMKRGLNFPGVFAGKVRHSPIWPI
jgi:hypothetical protein